MHTNYTQTDFRFSLNVQQAVEIVQIWIQLIKIAIEVKVCEKQLEREAGSKRTNKKQ